MAMTAPARAGDVESWDQVNFTVAQTENAAYSVFVSGRLRDDASELYDARAGTEVNYVVHPRISIRPAFLVRRQTNGNDFSWEYRPYVSSEFRLVDRAIRAIAAFRYERNIRDGLPDHNTYRTRGELELRRKALLPFLSEEIFFRREGAIRYRSRAGFRWPFAPGQRLELGYQFESKQNGNAWLPNHAIFATLSLRFAASGSK